MDYIEIDKTAIPYKFDMQIGGSTYTFEIQYNAEHDFFTIDLYLGTEVLVYGEKLVYGKPLFETIRNEKFPDVIIIPLDSTKQEIRITYDNLGESVLLYVIERNG
ncbi:phage baseplate plug family protein [Anaerosolibacter sp.]|uniref:phage baseplate plug family protein n=1 Tax=Anaerosolibacter sp. TaxID=1872527 RepID=UPI0039EE5478